MEGSKQPLANEDETVWVTFNGEIYNYRELRDELAAKGHRLRTQGDTETLVHLYEEYGPEMVHRLIGMFAFAIWDKKHRQLFLARDRLGIKPLYYCRQGERFRVRLGDQSVFAASADHRRGPARKASGTI